MSLQVFCPKLKCGGSKEVTCCVYLCPKATALRCPEYIRVYPQLVKLELDRKYLERYGEVKIPVPVKYLRRTVRGAKPKPTLPPR